MMLFTYLKLAVRNIFRNKLSSLTSIIGLSIALATVFFISLFIFHEYSYEKGFSDSERIMRLYETNVDPSGDVTQYCSIPAGIAPAMVEEIPEVISEFRIVIDDDDNGNYYTYNGKTIKLKGFPNATSSIMDVLGLKLVHGNLDTLPIEYSHTLISEKYAKFLFGNEDPVGKMLESGKSTIFISGVFQTIDWATHLPEFSFLGFNDRWYENLPKWQVPFSTSYVKLAKDCNLDSLQAKIDALVERNIGEDLKTSGKKYSIGLEPIRDIHLYSDLTTRFFSSKSQTEKAIIDIKRFVFVGIIVLLVALLNYVNLQTALLPRYSKQFGIIKVLGASHFQVARTKIAETIVINLISILLAMLLCYLLMPFVMKIAGFELNISLQQYLIATSTISAFALIFGIIVGIVVNQILVKIKLTDVIKGRLLQGSSNEKLRSIFVVFQMGALIILILLAVIVQKQMDFMMNRQKGFDAENVLIIDVPYYDDDNFDVRPFQNELEALSTVKSASGCSFLPFYGWASSTVATPGLSDDARYQIKRMRFDQNMLESLNIELLEGRNFTAEEVGSPDVLLINEAGVKYLNLDNPVGTDIPHCQITDGKISGSRKVIGVVKDFNMESMRLPISPLLISPSDQAPFFVLAKLNNGNITEAVEQIKPLWAKYYPEYHFEYDIMAETIAQAYKTDKRLLDLFKITTVIAIFIALFGIFTLTTSEVERRIKEVGIRKVLGATESNIIWLFISKYLKLILISFIVALAPALFFIHTWLNNYAYRITLNPLLFITAILIISFLFLLSIISQTWRAANVNPASTIRNE